MGNEVPQGVRNKIGHHLEIFVVYNFLIQIANEVKM